MANRRVNGDEVYQRQIAEFRQEGLMVLTSY